MFSKLYEDETGSIKRVSNEAKSNQMCIEKKLYNVFSGTIQIVYHIIHINFSIHKC